jgi:hypothetical protein
MKCYDIVLFSMPPPVNTHARSRRTAPRATTDASSVSARQRRLAAASSAGPRARASIDGARDELAPIRDLHDFEEQCVRQDALVSAEDRHYAGANRRPHEPFAVE